MAETATASYFYKAKNSSMSEIDSSAATQVPQLSAPVEVEEEAKQDQLESETSGLRYPSLKKELATEEPVVHTKDKAAIASTDPAVQFKDEVPVTSAGPESTKVRSVKSEVEDTNFPDETLSTWDLCEGSDSDDDWKPPNDSESSGRWKKQDCPPQRRRKIKDEQLGCHNMEPQNAISFVQGGSAVMSAEQESLAEIVDPEELKQAILAMCDDARRAQLRIMARRCYSNGLVSEELFCRIVTQHPSCTALSPAEVLSAPESEYPEIWEFAAKKMIESVPLKRAVEVICEAENLFRLDVMKQVRDAGISPITHGPVLASIKLMIPDLFRASFPILRVVCSTCSELTKRPSHGWNVEDWSVLLEKQSLDPVADLPMPRYWTALEGFVLGMAGALLLSWKLARR